MNTHVSRIARRQAHLSGFVKSPSLSPEASEDKDDDGDSSSDDDATTDEDASSTSDDEMIVTYPLSFVTKRGNSFWYERSHVLRGRVSIGDIFVRGSIYLLRDVVKTFCIFFFLSFRYIFLTL